MKKLITVLSVWLVLGCGYAYAKINSDAAFRFGMLSTLSKQMADEVRCMSLSPEDLKLLDMSMEEKYEMESGLLITSVGCETAKRKLQGQTEKEIAESYEGDPRLLRLTELMKIRD